MSPEICRPSGPVLGPLHPVAYARHRGSGNMHSVPAGHQSTAWPWVGPVSFLAWFPFGKDQRMSRPTRTQVPTLVWASLRTLAGSRRRQDTISWMDEVGQPSSFAKAAACCRALSGLMTTAGESAEPPWKTKQTQGPKSRSPPILRSAQRPQGLIRALHPSSRYGSPRTLPGRPTGI